MHAVHNLRKGSKVPMLYLATTAQNAGRHINNAHAAKKKENMNRIRILEDIMDIMPIMEVRLAVEVSHSQ